MLEMSTSSQLIFVAYNTSISNCEDYWFIHRENENVYVDNAKDVERILNYYQKSVLLYPEFDGEILAKGLISDVYSGKLKLPITVDDVMLCEVDEYVREDELLFELEWIIMFLSIVYNVGLK